MKKVLLINAYYESGSTGRLCMSIAEHLSNNYSFYFAYGDGPRKCNNGIRVTSPFFVRLRSFLFSRICRLGYLSVIPTIRLIIYIQRIKPDIIHLHNIHDWYLNFKLLFWFIKHTDIKVVWTFHDCWPFTGGCFHFVENQCLKWQTECKDCKHIKDFCTKHIFLDVKRPFRAKKRYFRINSLNITVVSKWLESVVKSSFFGANKIAVIPNCVDTSVFFPHKNNYFASYGLTDKFIVLGVASYWGKGKKLDSFFQLSSIIDKDDFIVLVGLNQQQKEKAAHYNNILAIDSIDSKDILAQVYSSANVLINFSTEETFGLVVAEALSCGTPAIVFDSTACGELIRDSRLGIVLKPGEDVTNALKEIKSNGKFYYRDTCHEYVQEYYSIRRIVEQYREQYQALLGGTGL